MMPDSEPQPTIMPANVEQNELAELFTAFCGRNTIVDNDVDCSKKAIEELRTLLDAGELLRNEAADQITYELGAPLAAAAAQAGIVHEGLIEDMIKHASGPLGVAMMLAYNIGLRDNMHKTGQALSKLFPSKPKDGDADVSE